VKNLIEAFENAEVEYAFTGALAVSFYGVPRTTSDVDIIVTPSKEVDVKKIATALRHVGLQVDERKIETALTSGYSIVTFKDKNNPYSVDIILSRSILEKIPGKINGVKTFFQSPEGLIAAKLRMIKATLPPERAIKDREDVKAILEFTPVDVDAVKKQAKKDKTLEIFQALTQ
jgi:hypothetical protein